MNDELDPTTPPNDTPPSHQQVTGDADTRADEATPVAASPDVTSGKATWLAMGAVALALALIWVAPGIEPTPAPSVGSMEPADSDLVGKPAPLQFTLKDMHGASVSLASFKGKVIVLNFWATWCGPCRAEIPSLIELQEQYGDDIVVLGVSVDDPIEKLKPYAEQMHINYPVLVGSGREDFQDAYGPLFGIPVTVFIGRDGVVANRHSALATKEEFEQQIKSLL